MCSYVAQHPDIRHDKETMKNNEKLYSLALSKDWNRCVRD